MKPFNKIFFQALMVIGVVWAVGCASLTGSLLKDPEVNLSTVEVSNVSLKDISLNLKLNVKNPNPIPLNLGKVDYSIQLSGKKVTEGLFENGVSIPASGEGELIVPLKFEYNTVGSLIDGLMKKTLTRDYEISGTAQFGLFAIPFSKKGQINIEKK